MGPQVVLVRAVKGTGKTTLHTLMGRGAHHLIDSNLLSSVTSQGWGFLSFDQLWEGVYRGDGSPEAIVDMHRGRYCTLLVEPGDFFARVAEHLRPRTRVEHLFLVAPDFLVESRQRSRLLSIAAVTAANVTKSSQYLELRDRRLVSLAAETASWPPWVHTTYLDASDFPLREITRSQAEALVDASDAAPRPHAQWRADLPVFAGPQPEWIGMGSMPSRSLRNVDVLLIGADTAPVLLAAAGHEARTITLVETDAPRLRVLRDWRKHYRLPVTYAEVDITREELPPLHCFGRLRRYSVGFIGLPSRWGAREQSAFQRVFEACDSVVVADGGGRPNRTHTAVELGVLECGRREAMKAADISDETGRRVRCMRQGRNTAYQQCSVQESE